MTPWAAWAIAAPCWSARWRDSRASRRQRLQNHALLHGFTHAHGLAALAFHGNHGGAATGFMPGQNPEQRIAAGHGCSHGSDRLGDRSQSLGHGLGIGLYRLRWQDRR